MFSSQQFSLFLGLSLLVVSVVSVNESNAQTAEVVTLEPTTKQASGSSGGEDIAQATVINSLTANSLLNSFLNSNSVLDDKDSSTTAGNAFSDVSAENPASENPASENPASENSVAETQSSESTALTDEIINDYSATSNLSQLVDTANELLNSPSGIQLLPLLPPGGILPNPLTPPAVPLVIDSRSMPPSSTRSIPEPSMSLLSGLGLATAGLLSRRSKFKQG